jgi:serine/threonine protein phosphatase PrpC
MSSGVRIESFARSHEGRVRTNNEDSFCDIPALCLWAVADGMGGHEYGEWASQAIVEKLAQTEIPPFFAGACHAISDAIHLANETVWEEGQRRQVQLGSTVVALHVCEGRFAVLWVGDSRAYLLRDGQLLQLTRDHTQVQELVDAGVISEEDAVDHPMGHVLARAVGVQSAVAVDGIADDVQSGDLFMLCSDGLTGQVKDHEIHDILTAQSGSAAIDSLIELVLERGGPDNVTIVLASVSETTMVSFGTQLGGIEP